MRGRKSTIPRVAHGCAPIRLRSQTATQEAEAKTERALAARSDRSWSARFDSLRVFWYRRIVSFDQRSQLETFREVKNVAPVFRPAVA